MKNIVAQFGSGID